VTTLLIWLTSDFVKLIGKTWSLNSENWWKSEEEPFWGNCSLFNAIICWAFWLLYISAEWLFLMICAVLAFITISTLA
jgi:hypothetical protein